MPVPVETTIESAAAAHQGHAGATFVSDLALSSAAISLWLVPFEQGLQILATIGAVVLVGLRIYVALKDVQTRNNAGGK